MMSDGADGNLHFACLCLTAATHAVAHPQPTSALCSRGSTPTITPTYGYTVPPEPLLESTP